MTTQDHLDSLIEAKDLIGQALDILHSVAHQTRDGWAESYIVAHLSILHSADSGYISRDANLDDWIAKLTGQLYPACPFCDGTTIPDLARPGVARCLDCGEPTAFTSAL